MIAFAVFVVRTNAAGPRGQTFTCQQAYAAARDAADSLVVDRRTIGSARAAGPSSCGFERWILAHRRAAP